MHNIKDLLAKYTSVILYFVFGVMTTIVNLAVYYVCYNMMEVANVPATICAWLIAVAFAFITNKIWVFGSKDFTGKILVHEVLTFLGARIVTGVLDVLVMYFAVDLLNWNSTVWKLLSNVIVIVLNYIASRFLIFKQTKHD